MTDQEAPRTDLTVARTILTQLGGRGFKMMTGARDFIGMPMALKFRIPMCGPKGRKINKINVELKADDTYHVTFGRIYGKTLTIVSDHEGIYAEDLRELVSLKTGLVLTIPRIRGVA